MEKFRITLTEGQIKHFEKVAKFLTQQQLKDYSLFPMSQVFSEIIDKINHSVAKSKKRRGCENGSRM